MFKLFVFLAVVCVAAAKPGFLASPLIGKLVSEKTIESHGNTVVHSSAPVVHAAPALPVATVPVANAALVAEKTIESHGNTVVHSSAPVVHAAPALAYTAAAAVAPVATVPVVKTVEAHGNSVVHAAAPIIHHAPLAYATYAAPSYYAYPAGAALVAEKTISSYGHSLVHHGV